MTEQPLPLTQEQDHDRRLSQLEGTAEQFVAQGRQTNTRLDHIDQTIAEQGSRINAQGNELRQAIDKQGSRIDEQGSALRQEIAAQGQQTNARFDHIEQTIAAQGHELRREISVLTRWLIGVQVTSLVALGTLILLRLP